MGILSADRGDGDFELRTFSSTGFMSRYRITVKPTVIELDPEGGDQPPPGWLFRRTIMHAAPGEFTETVQVAPPGKPFLDYYSARFHRKNASAAPVERGPQ